MSKTLIPADFLYQDEAQVKTKIAALRKAGPSQLQLVMDFDRTLTIGRRGVDGDITTWHILKEHLPPAGKTRYQKFFEHYRALELSGKMTHTHAKTWWSSILDLYVEYGLNLFEVEKDFLHKATIRPETKKLFGLCAKHDIPTVILSAGIGDVIELWARAFGVQPTIIMSTALQVDSDGTFTGWSRSSLIHSLNKKEMGHSHSVVDAIRRSRKMVILVGDSLGDADMAAGDENVFRVRVYDPRSDEAEDLQVVRSQAFQLFDVQIEAGSLRAVCQLLQTVVS